METSTDISFNSAFSLYPYYIVCLCVIVISVIMVFCFWGIIGIIVFLPILLIGLAIGRHYIIKQNAWTLYTIHKNKIVCSSKDDQAVIGFDSIIKFNAFKDGVVVEYFGIDNRKMRMSLIFGKKTAEACAKLKDAYNEWREHEDSLRRARRGIEAESAPGIASRRL